ncbi:DUF2180 family protein [Desulforhopalus sp. 52FAK]
MHCFVCAQLGKETPAIAVCITCGMCVCQEHLVREDLPIEDVKNFGFSKQKIVRAEKMPRIVCQSCHTALNG